MDALAAVRGRLSSLEADLAARDAREVVLILTALILLLHHLGLWYLASPITAVAISMLVWARVQVSPLAWAAALALLTLAAVRNWYHIDNHQYLLVYWCLAIVLALWLVPEESRSCLATSAAGLVGLSMTLAALQKVASPSYRSGAFFEYTLLADARLRVVTWLAGGVPLDHLVENRVLQDRVIHGSLLGVVTNTGTLLSTDEVRGLAILLTWAAVALEGTLGALFLIPRASLRLNAVRSALLAAFVVVTYPTAPVVGFGQLLLTLGLAQLAEECRRLRVVLVLMFVALPLVAIVPNLAVVARLFD